MLSPFFQNVSFFSQVIVVCLSYYLDLQHVSCGLNTFYLAFVDKRVRVLVLHNWNQLPETLKAKYFLATFKGLVSDWFGTKCKCKILLILLIIDCYWVVGQSQV